MKMTYLMLITLLSYLPGAVAQTCNATIYKSTPLARFTIHDDGTATDKQTGLLWRRCPLGFELRTQNTADLLDDRCVPAGDGYYDWQGALQATETANSQGGFAGYNDWRVPNIKELSSITEYSCSPSINALVFPDTLATKFWSSSFIPPGNSYVSIINFDTGLTSVQLRSVPFCMVRLVR